MIAWGPAMRAAVKVAPIAIEVARQVDRQVRPHVLAYRLARSVDGYVAPWKAGSGTHWLVFSDRGAQPLKVFPPLPEDEVAAATANLVPDELRHHTDMPEARARDAAAGVKDVPARAVARLRGRDHDTQDGGLYDDGDHGEEPA